MPKTYKLIVDPTVQAEQITPDTIAWVADWCKGKLSKEFDAENRIEKIIGVNVVTPFGIKFAGWGWYVVKKMSGDFKVYAPLAFESKYRLYEESNV